MGTRGKKSKGDLALAKTEVAERVAPPASLTDRQRVEWLRIVNDAPADYFSAAQIPLLAQYVKHAVEASAISSVIAELKDDKDADMLSLMKPYDKLLAMQERESRAMASLGIRLGFAKTAHREQRGHPPPIRKPWE